MRVIKAMDCKACRDEIELSPGGEQRRARSSAALAHMDVCARCRDFGAERSALLELVSSLEGINAPHDFEWRLRARLNADKRRNQDRPRLRLGFAPNTQAIALAASFARLLGVAVCIKQRCNEAFVVMAALVMVKVSTANEVKTTKDETATVSEATGASINGASKLNRTGSLTSNRVREARPARPAREAKEIPSASVAVATASGSTARSNDFSSSAAPVVTLFAVPVKDPSQHLKLLLDEGHGTTRTVRLQNITFGAQSIVERQAGGAAAAAGRSLDTNADGIW